jgi:hypothetical protein
MLQTMCDVIQRTKSVHYVTIVCVTVEVTVCIHYGSHTVLILHICKYFQVLLPILQKLQQNPQPPYSQQASNQSKSRVLFLIRVSFIQPTHPSVVRADLPEVHSNGFHHRFI